ncbi:ABC transporter permease [Propioniciclava coleopterorum]|uniref:ABC transporter permease n=1 Tax=Propioniciclava coleopterorum TaxID=2714937 RepID=A0A6G7Y8C9_9ACTN|nr:ABC transporter permease [Propioniciclava coleopterorum]QIK73072.1 ABC transporter permease [Propioniciclava coleopterorum]
MTTVDPMTLMDDAPIQLTTTESAAARRARLSAGGLLALLGLVLLVLAFRTQGNARYALSDAFAAVQLPTISVPGMPTVLVCALITLGVGVGFLTGRLTGSLRTWLAVLAGFALVLGFVSWAGAGSEFAFPVANQLSGSIMLATPLVFGALAGVLCENSGVVNVSIEGEFLVAAFTAATVGSITQSLVAALIAAMLAGMAMAALLALFAVRYIVDQVVLGVVLNLLAAGITGFLFDQLVQPNNATLNVAPQLPRISIPGLSAIPLLGPVLFQQSILFYLAVASVIFVAFLLYRTRWGLRVRSVGEHPEAADTVGINVRWTRWQAVLVGGLFAGLGGAFFTVGSTGAFIKDITVGNGFIALAAVIMGRWHPVRAALMALFFGFVTQLASQLQTLNTPMPSQFLLMLPYLATIVAVAGLIGRSRGPAADGVPFTK